MNSQCSTRKHGRPGERMPPEGAGAPYKGGDPAAPSGTATLLRLRPNRRPHLRQLPPQIGKEVSQPHLPVRLPCYDFVPIAGPTFDSSLPAKGVRPPASGVANFRDVTGGVYKARERIHRGVADPRLLATPASRGRVADPDPN